MTQQTDDSILNTETTDETAAPMPPDEADKPFGGRPTLIISLMDDSDVEFGAVNAELALDTTLCMMELAKTKMVAQHLGIIRAQRERAATMSNLVLPDAPRIAKP